MTIRDGKGLMVSAVVYNFNKPKLKGERFHTYDGKDIAFYYVDYRSHGLMDSHHSDSEQQSPVNQSQIVRQASTSHGAIDPTQLAFTWDLFDGQQPISLSTAKTQPESRKPLATARERNNHSEKPAATTLTSPMRATLRESEKDPEPVLRESTSFFDPSDEDIRWEDVA
jgi:hypothetical protein